MRNASLIFTIALLFTACVKKHVPVNHAELKGRGWIAEETAPGKWILVSRDEVEDAALATVCPKEYICAHGVVGAVIEIERTKK